MSWTTRALVLLLGCGGNPPPPPVHEHAAPRVTMIWGTGECIPRQRETDPCVQLTSADATAIRAAILAYLDTQNDMPDKDLVQRLASAPIAQWTTSAYAVTADAMPGQNAGLELKAFERVDATTTAGFTAALVHTSDSWMVIALSPYAAQ
jgi:hypothetical protein